MIESEIEYKQYLRNVRGLVEGTCNSYPTYLTAICNHLKIDISPQIITSEEDVNTILVKLKGTGINTNYWGNCQSALRAYLAFMQYAHSSSTVMPDEDVTYVEGAYVEVKVNRFERDPTARAECIKHYKPVCSVCSLDFLEMYGEIGRGFIHVHHITPISEIGVSYELDPVRDLVPVCPNCHAMLHTKKPPYSVRELKNIIRA